MRSTLLPGLVLLSAAASTTSTVAASPAGHARPSSSGQVACGTGPTVWTYIKARGLGAQGIGPERINHGHEVGV
jgi:hypothetical protein